MRQVVKLFSEQDTTELAQVIAQSLRKGDVVALYGELGVGKTFFTRELCSFLEVRETVSSPSYVLMNEYDGKFPIFHLDLYRLNAAEEVLELGIHELFEKGILIIEWPEIAEEFLPQNTIKIKFKFENSHRIAEVIR
jgi:tRNA threonylcarbamoyladenosine biosynthesis protein TsaE